MASRRDYATRAAEKIMHRFRDPSTDPLELDPLVGLIAGAFLPMENELKRLQARIEFLEAEGGDDG